MIVAGTGHRPEDSEPEGIVRTKIATKLRYTNGIDKIITGMAAGFDLWFADEARLLDLPIVAARPWAGHSPRVGDEELYQKILDAAVEIVNVNDSTSYPGAWVYPKRNHWMVDNAAVLLAYYNQDKKSGGTHECYTYAEKRNVPINNIYYDPPF